MRGKRANVASNDVCSGLTPACAGKTKAKPNVEALYQAHPRVCGENSGIGNTVRALRGSPPRVRGKRDDEVGGLQGGRLTPACAGKTLVFTECRLIGRAHPRVCGENGGSLFPVPWAHPRVCGENALVEASPLAPIGSPPRVRGKHVRRPPPPRERGLTPACAGKTRRALAPTGADEAHPRVCGENWSFTVPSPYCAGSPPRVRGKRGRPSIRTVPCRLTPACAGKTLWHYEIPSHR